MLADPRLSELVGLVRRLADADDRDRRLGDRPAPGARRPAANRVPAVTGGLPAWSEAFVPDRLAAIQPLDLPSALRRDWAFGDGSGAGVRVAVVDSGIDEAHPAVGALAGGVVIEPDESAASGVRIVPGPHDRSLRSRDRLRRDHPRARAGLRDLQRAGAGRLAQRSRRGVRGGPGLGDRATDGCGQPQSQHAEPGSGGDVLRAGGHGGVRQRDAGERGEQRPGAQLPLAVRGVFSVAAYAGRDPEQFVVNPAPPVEFGAPGIDLEVALDRRRCIMATGNSFAAPHIAGLVARIVGAHPGITPAEVKSRAPSARGQRRALTSPDRGRPPGVAPAPLLRATPGIAAAASGSTVGEHDAGLMVPRRPRSPTEPRQAVLQASSEELTGSLKALGVVGLLRNAGAKALRLVLMSGPASRPGGPGRRM